MTITVCDVCLCSKCARFDNITGTCFYSEFDDTEGHFKLSCTEMVDRNQCPISTCYEYAIVEYKHMEVEFND